MVYRSDLHHLFTSIISMRLASLPLFIGLASRLRIIFRRIFMSNIAVVVIALIIGLVLQRTKRFPDNAAATLNLYVIYIALPALILAEIPKLSFSHEAFVPVVAA